MKGNITTTSTATTQPIFDSNGTNTLIMGHPSTLQTLTLGANATIFTGSKLQIDNPAGMQIGGTGRTMILGSGGTMLVSPVPLSLPAATRSPIAVPQQLMAHSSSMQAATAAAEPARTVITPPRERLFSTPLQLQPLMPAELIGPR